MTNNQSDHKEVNRMILSQTLCKIAEQCPSKADLIRQLDSVLNPQVLDYMSVLLCCNNELYRFEITKRNWLVCWLFGKDQYKITECK